jgi:hypothetical protein
MTENRIFSLNFSENDYVVPIPIEKIQRDSSDMVPFGVDNMFPQNLLALTERTPLVSSIIDKITKYVYGEGVNDEYNNIIVDDKGTTFPELVYGVINDYITFGALGIQVRRNQYGEIKKLDRLRVERIRTNEDNDTFWYSKQWSKYSKANLVYNAYKGVDAKKQTDSIMYYKNPSGRHVYGFAPFWSSMDDITTAMALAEYATNTVNNAFTPSAIVTLCEGKPTPDEAKKVEKELNQKFCGTKNNAKLLVCFADSKDSAPDVTPFQSADVNAHYLSLKEQVRENILAAFSIDGILVGLHTNDGVFSQEAFEQSFKIFQKTEIQPIQQNIIKAFKKLGYDLEFKPFHIDWDNEQMESTVITDNGEEEQK